MDEVRTILAELKFKPEAIEEGMTSGMLMVSPLNFAVAGSLAAVQRALDSARKAGVHVVFAGNAHKAVDFETAQRLAAAIDKQGVKTIVVELRRPTG